MRIIYTFLFCIIFGHLSSPAQSDTLLIKLKDNKIEKIALSQIQKISFENLTSAPEINKSSSILLTGGNYPNPFSDQTSIEFEIYASGLVVISIFDETGKEIQTLKCESCIAGRNTLQWDCHDLNRNRVQSGTYYYEVRYHNEIQARKMLLIK